MQVLTAVTDKAKADVHLSQYLAQSLGPDQHLLDHASGHDQQVVPKSAAVPPGSVAQPLVDQSGKRRRRMIMRLLLRRGKSEYKLFSPCTAVASFEISPHLLGFKLYEQCSSYLLTPVTLPRSCDMQARLQHWRASWPLYSRWRLPSSSPTSAPALMPRAADTRCKAGLGSGAS